MYIFIYTKQFNNSSMNASYISVAMVTQLFGVFGFLSACEGGGASTSLIRPDIISSGTWPVSLFIAKIKRQKKKENSILTKPLL